MSKRMSSEVGQDSKRVQREQATQLNHLLHLANALCLAYRTARRRLDDADLAMTFEQLDKSHDRLRVQLAECVLDLGRKPTEKGDLQGVIGRGRVVLGDLSGDEGILRAMAKNEKLLTVAFQEALLTQTLPSCAVEIIETSLAHEAEHHSFYDRALGHFGD